MRSGEFLSHELSENLSGATADILAKVKILLDHMINTDSLQPSPNLSLYYSIWSLKTAALSSSLWYVERHAAPLMAVWTRIIWLVHEKQSCLYQSQQQRLVILDPPSPPPYPKSNKHLSQVNLKSARQLHISAKVDKQTNWLLLNEPEETSAGKCVSSHPFQC